LDRYDHQRLTTEGLNQRVVFMVSYADAMKAIEELRRKFGASSLFGNEKDASFQGSIAAID